MKFIFILQEKNEKNVKIQALNYKLIDLFCVFFLI